MSETQDRIKQATSLIRSAKYLTAFTGAGIGVESGIPPFRGPGGLWSQYDPRMLELDHFLAHPETAWPVIREIFYDHFGRAQPNEAHLALACLEAAGRLQVFITQNRERKTGAHKMFYGTSAALSTLITSLSETPPAAVSECPCRL